MFGSWVASEMPDGKDLPPDMKWEGGVSGKSYVFKEHARTDMDARLLAEARVEAGRAQNAVRAALAVDADLVPAPERAAIDAALERVARAASGPDRDAIAAAADALEEITKPFAERRMDRGIRKALSGLSVNELESRVGE